MKILFIVPSYKPAYIYGGTVVVTAKLAEQLVRLGHQVTVYTTTANGKDELDVEIGQEIIIEEVKVKYFRRITKDHTHISPALWGYLNKTVKNYDVVHLHSWWNFLIVGAAWICQRNNIKPVLSPHGMFSSYILQTRNSKKKTLLHKLIGKRLLENTFLHVSTQMEKEESKRLVPDWQEIVISNLVELPNKNIPRSVNNVFTVGFLSRIDPKKGLDVLIQALGKVSFPYRLLIAGSGESDYIECLKALSEDCGNSDNIEWVGWRNEEQKFIFLAELDLFALTSHSENFAIVVIESLSVGTPVLISNQVGLCDYILQNDYGWVCSLSISEVTDKLNEIYSDNQKIKKINRLGPIQIKENYDDINLSNQYIRFYRSIMKC